VPSLAFIEWRDRSPLPRNAWDAPNQDVEGEEDPGSVRTRFDWSGVEIYPTSLSNDLQ
jgi:hypothetical protein